MPPVMCHFKIIYNSTAGHLVAQLVETLCYNLEGHGFDS